ncbi:hypothetical protein OH821_02590 [Streptomyces sp. NBC_00842]|nr:hypothetical protein OH821_02590 [Streptomyces sp. NBC_00842]
MLEKIRVPRPGPGRPRVKPDSLAADKAYSNGPVREYLRRRGIRHTIPAKTNSQARPPAQGIARRTATRVRRRPLQEAQHRGEKQAAVLSYLRLGSIAVSSFLSRLFVPGVHAGGLILQPGAPGVLAARHLVQRAQAVDLCRVGPDDPQACLRVQVAGGPASPDPGIQRDLGHAQVLGEVAQPPLVFVQVGAVTVLLP